MSNSARVQYLHDDNGKTSSVLVPIELWREVSTKDETAYLLSSEANARRLRLAMSRDEFVPLEEVRAKLGI